MLSPVSDPGEEAWRAQFNALRAAVDTYYNIVIVDRTTDKIIAAGSVFIERKFMRGLGRVGHLEDVVVDKQQQGKKLGLRIINALTYISEVLGCYKSIFDGREYNLG